MRRWRERRKKWYVREEEKQLSIILAIDISGGDEFGTFLIRESNVAPGDYVLSFVHKPGTYGHYTINQKSDWRYSLNNETPIEGNMNDE